MVAMYGNSEEILEIPYDWMIADRDKSWLVRIDDRDVFVPKKKAEIFPNDDGDDRGGIFTMGRWIAEKLQVEAYAL